METQHGWYRVWMSHRVERHTKHKSGTWAMMRITRGSQRHREVLVAAGMREDGRKTRWN